MKKILKYIKETLIEAITFSSLRGFIFLGSIMLIGGQLLYFGNVITDIIGLILFSFIFLSTLFLIGLAIKNTIGDIKESIEDRKKRKEREKQ